MIDPVFQTPELQQLLATFRADHVRRIASDFLEMGYTGSNVPFYYEDDRYGLNPSAKPKTTPGLLDVATAAAALENFTGRAIFVTDRFLSGATSSGKRMTADEWFSDPKNRNFIQRLPGSQGQAVVRSWISGDYNGIENETELFALLGFDAAEAHYRDQMANAEGGVAFLGGAIGAGADPLSMVGGGAVIRAGGKAAVAFDVARQATVAKQLAALGVRISKTDSIATAAGKAILGGTAYTAVSETGLHVLDPKRTAEQTVTNLASNILFDSVMAGGFGYLSGRNAFRSTTHLSIDPHVITDASRIDMAALDTEIGNFLSGKESSRIKAAWDNLPADARVIDPHDPYAIYDRIKEQVLRDEGIPTRSISELPATETPLVLDKINELVGKDSAPEEFDQLISEILAARKEANDVRIGEQLNGPTPAAAPTTDVPAGNSGGPGISGQKTTSYRDYFADTTGVSAERMQKIMELTDKYLNNRLLGKGSFTVHSVQFSTNPELQMLYQKLYRSIYPSKAAAQGLVQGAAPFEAVAGMMRKKALTIQQSTDAAFRDFILDTNPSLANRLATNHAVGKELWSLLPGGERLLAQHAAWNELLDVLRLSHAVSEDARLETGKFLEEGHPMDALFGEKFRAYAESALGKEYMDDLINRAQVSSAQKNKSLPRLGAALNKALFDDLDALGRVRERLRPDVANPFKLPQTSVALPDDLSPGEFAAFFSAVKSRKMSPREVAEWFADNHPGSLERSEIDAITPQTVNRMRDAFYNNMGGFVPAERLKDALAIVRADGSRVGALNLRRTIGLNVRLMEQLELAHTLKDYLSEATGWDKRLVEAIRTPEGNLIEGFDRLTALSVTRDQKPATEGFFQELRQWNEKALAAIEQNMQRNAVEYTTDMAGREVSIEVREKEKKLIQDFFKNIRTRANMTGGTSTRSSQVVGRNLFAFTRNLFLHSQGITTLQDLGQVIAATSMAPFRTDFTQTMRGLLVNLRQLKQEGKSLGPLLDNVEFMADELRDVVLSRTSQGEYDPGIGDDVLAGTGIPRHTVGERLASFQERTAANVIQTLSLGQVVMDVAKTSSVLSTLHQVTGPDGLIMRMNAALDQIAKGKGFSEAMADVPPFFREQALKYLSAQDIRELAALIKNDVKREVSTPKRFFLDKFLGDSSVKVLDLPENATSAQKRAMEAVGMLINDLSTREKMSMPGWGEDILGSNGVSKQLMSFWMRPSISVFNRAYLGQSHKPFVARFGILGSMLLMAGAVDLLKAYSTSEEAAVRKMNEIDKDFFAWAAKRAGWAGAMGWAGEKGVNFLAAMLNPQPGSAMFGAPGVREITPAPLGALGTGIAGLLGVEQALTGQASSRTTADNLWKLVSSAGFGNDTLTFRLMGRFGRETGVYGQENNSFDIQKLWYDALRVPVDKR